MKHLKNFVAAFLGFFALWFSSFANAAALTSADFGTLQTDITGTIGVAAGIGVALMIVGLGWDVGISLVKKFTKKGATA
jgi:hypothetical protein